MSPMKAIDAVIGVLVFILVAICVVMFIGFVWAAFAAIFGLFFIVWASGRRFVITKTIGKKKVVIGHLRWFTFTKAP